MSVARPLPTLLSQALVAHTIELDNEAEQRMPHRTTREGTPEADRVGPWLVSYALWANVLQYLHGEALTVADLRARARTNELLLAGLRRWGYIAVTPPPGHPRRNPPQDEATVRLKKAGRQAGAIWSQLPGVIDERWRERLGAPAVARLERALWAVFDGLPIDPPAFLPVIHPAQGGTVDTPRPHAATGERAHRLPPNAALSPLLSGVLLAFAVEFESHARISLAISANTLRVLHNAGTRTGDLPRLTGVSREANAMCTGWLEGNGSAVIEPDPTAGRGKVVRLTTKGKRAQQIYLGLVGDTEDSWRARYGVTAVDELRAALETVVGDGTFASSPLAPGLVPHPDVWRARVRRPETLPHHPMVLHRGGYPDGS